MSLLPSVRKHRRKARLLSGADLSYADLPGVNGRTIEQLLSADSLEGATMPDGQILKSDDNHDGPTLDEWLKSKGRGEDGENSKAGTKHLTEIS